MTDLVDAICALAVHHEKVYFRWRPFLPDDKDEFILDLAVLAQCQFIVTYNKSDFVGVEKFCIQVVTAKELLQAIGAIK